jgi:hypothetical protein
MRANVIRSLPIKSVDRGVLRLAPPGDREDDVPRRAPSRPVPVDREDLPYKVKIWNETGASVKQIVAITANASINARVPGPSHYLAPQEQRRRPLERPAALTLAHRHWHSASGAETRDD